jgi:hypothetical protein
MAFQKYSHLDQSLFTRFIRLGTPYVELNAQVGMEGGREREQREGREGAEGESRGRNVTSLGPNLFRIFFPSSLFYIITLFPNP